MDTKLTLKLDKEVIEKAKGYASSQKRSLSGIIESYLRTLTESGNAPPEAGLEISAFVKNLRTGVTIPASFEDKESYNSYRSDKYL
jgi:hypothetical protein